MGTSYPIRVIITKGKKPPLRTDEIQEFEPVGNKFFNDIKRIKPSSKSNPYADIFRVLGLEEDTSDFEVIASRTSK